MENDTQSNSDGIEGIIADIMHIVKKLDKGSLIRLLRYATKLL